MLKKIKELFKNGYLFVFVLSGIGALLSFALSTILAKTLGSDRYGIIQYYVSVINTLSLFLQFGLPTFMVKHSQFVDDKHSFLSKYFIVQSTISLISFPLFFFVAYFALAKLGRDLLTILIIFLCSYFYSLALTFINYILGRKKFRLSVFLESVFSKLILIIFVGISILFKNLLLIEKGYLFVFMASYILICSPFIFKNVRITKIKLEKRNIIPILLFLLISLTGSLNTNISKVFQGEIFNDDRILGIYSISMQIVNLGTLFCAVITNISKPFFSKYSKENNSKELIAYYSKTVRLCSFIAIPFMFAFIFQAEKVMGLFGDSFLGYPQFLILSCVYGLIISITGPCGTLLCMANKEKYDLISGAINCLVFLISIIALKNVTYLAIPIAMIISISISKIFSIIVILIFYKTNPFPIKTLIYLGIIAFICFDVFTGLNKINSTGFWLAFNILIGAFIILVCFLLSPYRDDKNFLIKGDSSQ